MTAGIILHAPLRTGVAGAVWQDALLRALPYARQLHLTSRAEAARRASLGGLALALLAAERVAGRAFAPREIAFPVDGKPRIAQGPCFSLSHTPGRVAVVASPTLDVGIDIEECAHGTDPDARAKLVRWTATEALLKARGLGLREVSEVALDASCTFGQVRGERYELHLVASITGVVGHVAATARAAWSCEEIELDGDGLLAALERSLGLPPQVE